MSQHTPRKGRVSLPLHCYHITACTYQRRPIFRSFDNGRLVITEMQRLQKEGLVESLTWVLMPDHLHWLLYLKEQTSLSATLQLLKGRSAFLINHSNKQSAPVWQKGFHDHAVRREEDLVQISRYIIANPLRAGLVKKIGHYPFWDSEFL